MAAQDVVESIRNSYKDCKLDHIKIFIYQDGNTETSMLCSCGYAFSGVGKDLDAAMLRLRINYTEFHEEHYEGKR